MLPLLKQPKTLLTLLVPLAMLLVLGLATLRFADNGLLAPDYWLHDYLTQRQLATAQARPPSVGIAVVDVDEPSLQALGRWPWPRNTVAELLNTLLTHYKVELLGVDILFVDETSPATESAPANNGDAALLAMLRHPQVVSALVYSTTPGLRKGSWQGPVQLANPSQHPLPVAQSWLTQPEGTAPAHLAHITAIKSSDGAVRKVAPLACHPEYGCLESLPLALFRMVLGVQPNYQLAADGQLALAEPGGNATQLYPVARLGKSGHGWLPWQEYANPNVYFSASSILARTVPADALAGKVVLVGSTSLGLYDTVVTPFSAQYPAIEVHRNALLAMLNGSSLHSPAANLPAQFAFALLLSLLVWFLFTAIENPLAGLAALLVALAGWATWVVLARGAGQVWGVALPLAWGVAYGFYLLGIRAWLLQRRKAELVARFAPYVSRPVLDRLRQENFAAIGSAPTRAQLSVLFVDLRNFTGLADSLSAPELAQVVRQAMNALSDVVLAHDGTIDKYLGDGLLAFWGAPVNQPNHADLAFKAAVGMVRALDALRYHQPKLPPLAVGIGINTGEAVVGDLGSDKRYDFSVLGHVVNLANRFERLTRQLDRVQIVCGQATVQASPTAQAMLAQPLHYPYNYHFKGVDYPVHCFTTVPQAGPLPRTAGPLLGKLLPALLLAAGLHLGFSSPPAQAANPPANNRVAQLQAQIQANPSDGSLVVDLLRAQLDAGDLEGALATRSQLVQMGAPPGILALVDGWLTALANQQGGGLLVQGGGPATAGQGVQPARGRIQLEMGRDTNPNLGPRGRELLLEINGVQQLIELAPGSQPQASNYLGARVDYELPTRLAGRSHSILLGGSANHYLSDVKGDYSAYAGLYTPLGSTWLGCGPRLQCTNTAVLYVGNVLGVGYQYANNRLGWATGGQGAGAGGSGLHLWGVAVGHLQRQGRSEFNQLVGDYRYISPSGTVATTAQAQWVQGSTGRLAGGGYALLGAGVDLQPSTSSPWRLSLQATQQEDFDPYAPALFGGTRRSQTGLKTTLEYEAWRTPGQVVRVVASRSTVSSSIDLFTSDRNLLLVRWELLR